MRQLIIISILLSLLSCKRKDPSSHASSGIVKHETYDKLSPRDLGINKERFTASPSEKEVAIFRVEKINRIDPRYNFTYDQIYWNNKNEETTVDVVIVPLSFYNGYPEPEKGEDGRIQEETVFRDSWKLKAGSYTDEIKKYMFIGSGFNWQNKNFRIKALGVDYGYSKSSATGSMMYTKNSETSSNDLEYKFTMFILSLENAKKMHPKLEIERGESTTSWRSAYPIREK